MRRGWLVLAIVCVLAGVASAQPRRTSIEEQPESPTPPTVYLYSFGMGDVIFEKFGHSALCLEYSTIEPPMFVCFNYGVTDFHDPQGLVWGFIRSKQKFWVEPVPEREILRFYTQFEDRTVWRQKLPLTDAQARKVEAHLWNDLKPENRYYIYDHFYDNCTTRLRDILDEATDGALRAGTEGKYHPLTFREFGQRGLAEFPPLLAFSDFITGRALDHRPTMWEAMFHPDELRKAVEEKLHAPVEVMYTRQGHGFPDQPDMDRRYVILLSILLSIPLAIARWKGRYERLALVVSGLPLYVIGVLVWAILAIVTIEWIRWNEVVFLFVPTDLALPFLRPLWRQRYARIRVAMIAAVSALCAIGVCKQPLWVPAFVAFLPLALVAFDPPRRAASARASDLTTSRAAG